MDNEENRLPETETPDTPVVQADNEPDTTVPEADTPEEHTPESTAAETESEREPEPEADSESEEDTRQVPLAALHEERQKRREAMQRYKELEEKWSKASERLDQFLSKQEEVDDFDLSDYVDYDEDPVGYIRSKVDNLSEKLTAQERAALEQQQQYKQQQEIAEKQEKWKAAAANYVKEHPDAPEAYAHWRDTTMRSLMSLGLSRDDAYNEFTRLEWQAYNNAEGLGENPMAVAVEAARAIGWTPKKAAPKEEGEQKIERLQKGQQASKSLSSAGGKPTRELTLETLSDMTDDEFAELSDKDFRRVMGG